jgi:hypothetical protein
MDEHKAGQGLPLFEVWKKYEEVAMHFNDLLMRLRIQALAGVAALAVLAGIFSNVKTYNFHGTWLIAAGAFGALCLLWVAIWVLDMLYYNRLLIGSVVAIIDLEEKSKETTTISRLEISSIIEKSVWNKLPAPIGLRSRWYLLRGVILFYLIVFFTLLTGLYLSACAAWPDLKPFERLATWITGRF